MINIDWPAKKLALKVHCRNYINDPLKRRTKAKGKWAIAFYCQKAHIVTDLEMSILILIAYLLALAHSNRKTLDGLVYQEKANRNILYSRSYGSVKNTILFRKTPICLIQTKRLNLGIEEKFLG